MLTDVYMNFRKSSLTDKNWLIGIDWYGVVRERPTNAGLACGE